MSTTREDNHHDRSSTTRLADSVDQMMRLPLEMTSATWDLMMEGMERMTGRRASRRNRTTESTSTTSTERTSGSTSGGSWFGSSENDLGGDDLKYVVWSIAFTKPDYECVLEPQREEIVNYSTDGTSFGAMKIARFLDRARHGHVAKPESWSDEYPPHHSRSERKAEGKESSDADRGWRIPADDHKYIKFLYRVDHRMAKQEDEVERVTIERGTETKTVKIV